MDVTDYSYLTRKSHVPAFGSWEYCNNDDFPIPFTQCFESAATQPDLLRYSYSADRDLYVAGDLYDNRILTPAMIVVPRRHRKGKGESYGIRGKGKGRRDAWVVCECECECDMKGGSAASVVPPPKQAPKAVDEDLYKISPDLLYSRPKQRRVWGLLSSCLRPCCTR